TRSPHVLPPPPPRRPPTRRCYSPWSLLVHVHGRDREPSARPAHPSPDAPAGVLGRGPARSEHAGEPHAPSVRPLRPVARRRPDPPPGGGGHAQARRAPEVAPDLGNGQHRAVGPDLGDDLPARPHLLGR